MSKRTKLLMGTGGVVAVVAILLIGLMAIGTVRAQTPPATGLASNAANAPQGTTQDFLGKLAKNLGISQDKLTGAIKDTESQMLDQAVQQGQLTQAQADQLRQQIQNSPDGIAGFGMHGLQQYGMPTEGQGYGELGEGHYMHGQGGVPWQSPPTQQAPGSSTPGQQQGQSGPGGFSVGGSA